MTVDGGYLSAFILVIVLCMLLFTTSSSFLFITFDVFVFSIRSELKARSYLCPLARDSTSIVAAVIVYVQGCCPNRIKIPRCQVIQVRPYN